jgi:aspartyl-tRNA(Asn)/glutamyl-tRNA(Gln) amidotransferase subunit C
MPADRLSEDDIRKVASLSRLAVRDEEVAQYQAQLSAVLNYVQRLREIGLDGVEPMTSIANTTNRLADDTPGPTLPIGALQALAPQSFGRFIQVPKVFEDGGGA